MQDYFWNIVSKRNRLFVTTEFSLQVFDITDPVDPQLVQFVPFVDDVRHMLVRGDTLVVLGHHALYSFRINLPPVDCGDANADGAINAGDAVFLINYIFKGGSPPDPFESADANSDGMINAGDAVYLINYIFKNGPPPCDTRGDG